MASVPRPCVALRNMARSSFPSLYAEREAELRGLNVKVRTLRNKVDAVLASTRRVESEELVDVSRRGHGAREVVDAILEAPSTERVASDEAFSRLERCMRLWQRSLFVPSPIKLDKRLLEEWLFVAACSQPLTALMFCILENCVILFSCIAVVLCLVLALEFRRAAWRGRFVVIPPVVVACIIMPASLSWLAYTLK